MPDPLQDGSTNAPLTFLQQLQRLNSRQEAVTDLLDELLTASLALSSHQAALILFTRRSLQDIHSGRGYLYRIRMLNEICAAHLYSASVANGKLRKSATWASMLVAAAALAFALSRANRFASLSKANTRPSAPMRAAPRYTFVGQDAYSHIFVHFPDLGDFK